MTDFEKAIDLLKSEGQNLSGSVSRSWLIRLFELIAELNELNDQL